MQPSGDPQRDAAYAITGRDALVVVVGPAGTGKTRTTATAVAALQAQERPVVGLAPSGKAADVLATEAGCPTDTLAGFLTRHRHQPTPWPAGTTVILDEAGMAATADLAQLVDLVREHQWRLVAVGDPQQLPSVARGGVFAHWCDTIPHHTLDTPRRFHEPWEAAASLAPPHRRPRRRTDLRRTRPPPHSPPGARRRPGRTRPTSPPHDGRSDRRDHHQHRRDRPGHQPRDPMATQNAVCRAGRPSRRHQRSPGDQIATRRNDPHLRTDHR